MAGQLDSNYSRKLSTQVDALKEEVIFYVREHFENLKLGFTEYCQNISEGLLLSNDFSAIYSQVIEDKKLLENMANDIGQFSTHFVLKENFDRYVKKLERTHEKYVDYSKQLIVPEVTLAKGEDFLKKLQKLLREEIRFENNLGQYSAALREDMISGDNTGGLKIGEEGKNRSMIGNIAKADAMDRPDASYDINFLHYFQEGSKKVHFMDLEKKVLLWDTLDLDLGFEIPLFSATVAARRDCVILAGGIDIGRKNTLGDVYVLNKPTRTLLKTGEMQEPRNNFSLVRLKDKIYAVGGCNDKNGKLNSCESVLFFYEDSNSG